MRQVISLGGAVGLWVVKGTKAELPIVAPELGLQSLTGSSAFVSFAVFSNDLVDRLWLEVVVDAHLVILRVGHQTQPLRLVPRRQHLQALVYIVK